MSWAVIANQSHFELGNGEESDLLWVQSLVKEFPMKMKEKLAMLISTCAADSASFSESSNVNSQNNSVDHVMGAWIEQF